MRNFHSFVFPAAWVMAALAVLGTASPAIGQGRAYEGIFGGSSANSGRPRSLDLSVLGAGGYERNNEEAEARRAEAEQIFRKLADGRPLGPNGGPSGPAGK